MTDAYCINHYRQKKYEDEIKHLKFEDELLQKAYDEYLSVREQFGDTSPVCMANIATAANRRLKLEGKMRSYDDTRVSKAKAISIDVEVNHSRTPWLLLFKDGRMGVTPSVNIRLGEKITAESFDPITAASNVLMPYGGINQLTKAQAHVHKVPIENGRSDSCSFMARGHNAELATSDPYRAAYLSIVEAISRLVASGATADNVYISFFENYKTNTADVEKYGRSIAALLGAFEAQLHIGVGNIGVEDAMSAHFDSLKPEPAIVTHAVTMGRAGDAVSPEFKQANHTVIYLKPYVEMNNRSVGEGLPAPDSLRSIWRKTHELIEQGMVVAAATPGAGGIGEMLEQMVLGNDVACVLDKNSHEQVDIFGYEYGGMILELADKLVAADVKYEDDEFELVELGRTENELRLTKTKETLQDIRYYSRIWTTTLFKAAKPKVVVPVFPGTNSGIETARVLNEAGAEARIVRISNRNLNEYRRGLEQFSAEMHRAQMLVIPGRYSYGKEFDDSLEFMKQFFERDKVKEDITELLERRDGLICGMGTGFQVLLDLGLITYGEIRDEVKEAPVLSFAEVDCTWPRIVQVKIASNSSPWLRYSEVGRSFSTPVAYGDGCVTGPDELLQKLAVRGQVATQYVDLNGDACCNDESNPYNSMLAIEGLTSPDGRIFGKMGHAERYGDGLYKNVPGDYNLGIFDNAVKYFKY